MSYDLQIHTALALDPMTLPVPDLRWNEEDGTLYVHRDGVSTRLTTVHRGDGRVTVTIRALASDADTDLALAIAASFGLPVETEHFGTVDPDALPELHDAAWRASMAASGAGSLESMIRRGRGPMSVPGPVRSLVVGSRLLSELEGEGFAARLIEALRAIQWDVPPGFRDAGVFLSGEPPDQIRLAIWIGEDDLLIPNVQTVALSSPPDDVVVPMDVVLALAGDHATRLDEVQLLVRGFTATEWQAVVDRARPYRISASSQSRRTPPGERGTIRR